MSWGNFQGAIDTDKNYSNVACITHTNEAKIYDIKEGDLLTTFDRSKIAAAMKVMLLVTAVM